MIAIPSVQNFNVNVREYAATPHIEEEYFLKTTNRMTIGYRKIASQKEAAVALSRLSDADLRRLERIARFRAIGLYELDWQDLLHDAIVRLLDGTRHWPTSVPLIAFLHETMRSIASDHWRRRYTNPVILEAQLSRKDNDSNPFLVESVSDPTVDLERDVSVDETLARIMKVFEGDSIAMRVIFGMAVGKSPNEIQTENHISAKQYATTQRRIRRTLTREFPNGSATK